MSGKFDLKEPYYRQLNPQPAAAWPQEQQQEQQQQQGLQQVSYDQQAEMPHMQQAAFGWPAAQQNLMLQNYHGLMGHLNQGQTGPMRPGQQQMYQQGWH